MISNPYAAIPYKESAWSEGFCKGLAAIGSPSPSDAIAAEDVDAFNEGVSSGSDAAARGIPFDSPCVPALEGAPGHDVAMAVDAVHVLHAGWEARHLATLAGALTSLLIVVIELGTSANHARPANQVLPALGREMADRLASFGAESLEFFSGVNLDLASADCTMSMSNLFMTLDQARTSAEEAAGPDGWIIVSWRTDQSNSFRVVSTSEDA